MQTTRASCSVLINAAEPGKRTMDGALSAASHGRVSARPGGVALIKMPQAPVGQNIRKKRLATLRFSK